MKIKPPKVKYNATIHLDDNDERIFWEKIYAAAVCAKRKNPDSVAFQAVRDRRVRCAVIDARS